MLADVSHEVPPQDPFKTVYVAKDGFKEVSDKVNFDLHCKDEVLLRQPDVKFGYRHQAPWTQKTRETRCKGDDRTFDKIVATSIIKEKVEA